MTKKRPAEKVEAEQAYIAGATWLLKRARGLLMERVDAVKVFAVSGAQWFTLKPYADLAENEREFWAIVAHLLNEAGLGINAIDSVLEVGAKTAQTRIEEMKAQLPKGGKLYKQ